MSVQIKSRLSLCKHWSEAMKSGPTALSKHFGFAVCGKELSGVFRERDLVAMEVGRGDSRSLAVFTRGRW